MSVTQTLRSRSPRLVIAALLAAGIGAVAVPAMAQGQGGPAGPGGMHGHMMMDHGGHGMQGMGRMLDLVNATPDQRAKIKAIMDAAHTDLKAQHQAGMALRQQQMALFAQPTIDANAAESLRQQMLAQHDAASRRMLQARIDAANVLTADQRKAIADRMSQRRAMMERHRAERQSLGIAPR